MSEFESYLKKASDFHGHACAGTALGTKMTLAAMKALDMDPAKKHKNLIVYVEIDRCMTDAVQAITGCSLGHRSLKYVDYGKFAATFVDLKNGRALRATIKESFDSHRPMEEISAILGNMPDDELVILQEVEIDISERDLPGNPSRRAYCSICGERVMDGRDVSSNGKALCRACRDGKYYDEKNRNE